MKEALRFGEIDVIQPCYGLLWRFIDRDILPFAIENKIAVIPYSPLGQGILTGSMQPGHTFNQKGIPDRIRRCLHRKTLNVRWP